MRNKDYIELYRFSSDYPAYYEQLAAAQGMDLLATARTRDAEGTVTEEARRVLFNVSAEIKNTFNEYACQVPPLLKGCTVVNLCCGSGRDLFVLAQLVGPEGRVIGIEPNAQKLAIAEKYLAKEMRQFGFATANVELYNACPEQLDMVEDDTADVVLSNCTFNASPDKFAYLHEVQRVLKDGGEFYFTDVFTDVRIPAALSGDMAKRAAYLGGAMYIGDFKRLCHMNDLADPRFLITNKTPLSAEEKQAFDGIAFATITCRVMNSPVAEDVCEAFGETITYDGSLPDFPDYFLFDKDIKFPKGITCTVCSNVAAVAAYGSRYGVCLNYTGNEERHLGEIAGDRIIKTAPEFNGVADEDDVPVVASCC